MKIALLLSTLAFCAADFVERPDSWITGQVQSAFVFNKSMRGLKASVDTSEGVVTLRGEADYEAQRDLAAEHAARIEGVRKVINLITVKSERARRDDAVTASVLSALFSRPATRGLRLSVNTVDGIVTLSGAVRKPAERELAERVARGAPGVRGVSNRLTVE